MNDLITETVKFLNRGLEEVNESSNFDQAVQELLGYADEEERVINKLHKPLVKKLAKDMDAGKYNHKKATTEWLDVVKKAIKMDKSFSKKKYTNDLNNVIGRVAELIAKEYKDEIELAHKSGDNVMDMFG